MDGKDFKSWNRVPKHEQQPIAIEISSGSGHLSRALRRHCRQLTVFEVDLKHEPAFDLTHRKNQRQLIQFILRNRVDFIWLGTPCNSWSRARRNDRRGPGPLRDDENYILCLPQLTTGDYNKVRAGNCLMRFSAKIFRMCVQLGIPVALENSHTSRIWLAPPIKHLLSHRHVLHDFTDFCQEGTAWRKRTRIMFAHIDLRSCFHQCRGPRGICSRTQAAHVTLEGMDPRRGSS